MNILHIASRIVLICMTYILSINLFAASSSGNGQFGLPPFKPFTHLLRPSPATVGSSTDKFSALRRRPYTTEELFAQLRTCSVSAEREPALSPTTCSIFEEQRASLIAELLDLQANIKNNVTNLPALTTDELRRNYALVKQVKAPELTELQTALEHELLKYERYGTDASMFSSFFTTDNVNPADRIAILHTYEMAVNNAIENYYTEVTQNIDDEDAYFLEPAEVAQLVFGQEETAQYIENIRQTYARVARPQYQGATVVVDMSDDVRQQRGNTCGYHALFNADTLYAWLTRKITERNALQKLAEGPDVAVCKDAMAELSGASASQNFENIFDDEIEKLIASSLFGLAAEHITIIASADQLQEAFFGGLGSIFAEIYGSVPTIVERLHREPGFTHAFIVGTAGAEGTGHWFVAVAHNEDGRIKLYVADSKANKEYGRAYYARSDKIQILLNVLNADSTTLQAALNQ